MYFNIKNYLKNKYIHTVKHTWYIVENDAQ
jgi:hypothetical protein